MTFGILIMVGRTESADGFAHQREVAGLEVRIHQAGEVGRRDVVEVADPLDGRGRAEAQAGRADGLSAA